MAVLAVAVLAVVDLPVAAVLQEEVGHQAVVDPQVVAGLPAVAGHRMKLPMTIRLLSR